MKTLSEQIKAEIEETAAALGLEPRTVAMRAGQGGKFYDRMCQGKRLWPETAENVRARLRKMMEGTAA